MYKIFSRFTRLLFPLILFLQTGTLLAEEEEEEMLSAAELLAECEEGATPTEPNQYCMHYVFGLVSTMDMLQQAGEMPKLFCIDPAVISLQEVTLKITADLKSMPERLDEDAYILVSQALNKLYPCGKPGV